MRDAVKGRTIGRFAPTPSGRMHLGNVYAAMIAYLSVKSSGGEFLLRIEDLDYARCPVGAAEEIIRDLRRLGFEFDGEILRQSKRSHIYEEYEKILKDKGLTYPCFCSRAELHSAAAPHNGDNYVYDGKCAGLSQEQIAEKRKTRAACERVRVPDITVSFADRVFGGYSQNLKSECGDFIIRRSDGVFAYQLAVTVDDALSGVTEVVRGVDLISSTPRQIWLCEELGFEPPSYAHLPLLTAADGRRLSKREGDTLASALESHTPQQIVGGLAYLAGLLPKYEPTTLKELIPLFDFGKIHDSPAVAIEDIAE